MQVANEQLKGVLDALRLEVKPFNIQVSMIEPGGIDTPMAQGEPNFMKVSGRGAYINLANNLKRLFVKATHQESPEDVAHTIQKIADTKRPKSRYVTGHGTKMLVNTKKILSDNLMDKLITRMIDRS